MKIRSITAFIPVTTSDAVRQAVQDCQQIKANILEQGWEVQTLRLATPPFSTWLPLEKSPSSSILQFEERVLGVGFDYLSVGSLSVDDLPAARWIPDILSLTKSTFCTMQLVKDQHTVSNKAIREAAGIIEQNSRSDPLGFTNLRFAALANVPNGCPFFPAASAESDEPAYALAIEGADLAVDAFCESGTAQEASDKLTTRITSIAKQLESICSSIVGDRFSGIDFTLAPFPDQLRSIGTALEHLGLSAFGQHGSLAASALLMSILDQCKFKKIGFNGLMLPVLEDSTLAQRNIEGYLSISQLLLYSTVCGTGLDCIPLPGDVQKPVLEAILLDLAVLSCRLQKPLTARLMPVPGKKVGEMTSYEFDYFANSRIMDPRGQGVDGILAKSQEFSVFPRHQ